MLALLLALSGCGLFGATEGTTPEPEERGLVTATVAGAQIVSLQRPTRGAVHLALFIDAGSRDASPPQVATAAAFIAEARADGAARARVLPDGTSFELDCPTAELARCVATLAGVLGTRRATAAEIERARARLTAARRRAAADEARAADGLALAALLGEGAAGLAPFGEADDGGVTVEAVSAFLDAHYGPRRAMFVAAGEVSSRALVEALLPALEAAPRAAAARATRALPRRSEARPEVSVGESSIVSVAIVARDLGDAAALARAIAESVPARDGIVPALHAFEIRGAALVLGHVAHEDLAEAATQLARAAGHAIAEVEATGSTPTLPDDPVESARVIGVRWIASSDAAAGERAMALGAVVAGGRGDRAGDGDPDAQVSADAVRVLADAMSRATRGPAIRGEISARVASVVLPNGARIDVRRRDGDRRVGIALRFSGGAGADPPAVHGRAALLAVLAAEVCPVLGPGGVRAHAASLDATVAPRISARTWGLAIEAPTERFTEALDLASRCALAVEPSRADVERARLLLLDRLHGGPAMGAWAARSLSPDAPGEIAPMGSLDAVRETSVSSVRRAWRESSAGARLAVAVVGDVDVGDAVTRVARRVSGLPSGTAAPPSPDVALPEAEGPLAVEFDAPQPRVVITFRGRVALGRVPLETGARVFGEGVLEGLGRERGLRGVWADGGVDRRGAWAAVALDAGEAALADLPARVSAVVSRLDDGALTRAVEARARARARLEARPAEAADRIARGRLHREANGDAQATWSALRAAAPGYVIGRPPRD